jgi:hypothetical protein
MGFGVKAKNPRLTGNRGFFKNRSSLYQNFIPTMPKRRESRCQMAVQPITGACFIPLVSIVFMFNRAQETPFGSACQKDSFTMKNSLSQGLSCGEVMLN